MSRHFRRYCFSLALRLKMTVNELLTKMDSAEISEWMAYDQTQSEDWVKKYTREKELEYSRQQSDEERVKAFKRMFGGA